VLADHAAQGICANTMSPGAIETRRMRRDLCLASAASAFMTRGERLIGGGHTAV
jgi:hypothetical protein